MSLLIEIDKVTEVLLADGWHVVDWNAPGKVSSFEIDAYEFLRYRADENHRDHVTAVGGGEVSGVSAVGATWQTAGIQIACPFPSILAVKHKN